MKILLATHNPAKIRDYKRILSDRGFEVETLNGLGIVDKFNETNDTFEANAQDKAKYYYKLANRPTIAEDGGFAIDFLNGEPGVLSRRWPGHEASDQEIIDFLKNKISGIPKNRRSARFVAVACLIKSASEIYCSKNSIEGYLTNEYNENYENGFPYRAFFIEKTYNKYLMDLSPEEYQKINHRQKNIEQLLKHL